jgi:hypothetical protein
MTQPTTLAPRAVTTPEQQELLDAESLAYELEAEATVTAALEGQVVAANIAITVLFGSLLVAGGGVLTAEAVSQLRAFIAQVLGGIAPSMTRLLADQVQRGIRLGITQAYDDTPGPDEPVTVTDPAISHVVQDIDPRALRQLEKAVSVSRVLPMTRQADIDTVTSTAYRSVTQAQGDTRWAANRSVNAGTAEVAQQAGANLLWVAERDACLHCLAYSGYVTVPGEVFPAELTFAMKPIALAAVPYPPRHPNCRCRVNVWYGPAGEPEGMTSRQAPGALAREARRSVLRGWSDYASLPERLRAADLLLARGADLPKTVAARARADVKRGKFSERHKDQLPGLR